ncbi:MULTISPECIES: adenylate/guanylate cyclase domain-containing protein [unclassified Mycobacterium]|uniref:adenylate/guanylate cyclase domain-containing protein n=1 Tax=unclassified Mycobacterium TaxID=2642494 RepID=UPI0007400F77|nr:MULTISPECIES: adenylate/guanylate cyclase domain-containing protein [unclassified Mycobacterium]KUH83145.1 adenylate/guanylate cyclase [Mycobacterium sp. GA-0227b]KUH84444.1 adenylate/guanylate cyclase [Mycobacterium sp. GA-1999]
MSLKEELKSYVAAVHKGQWKTRDGTKVPETDDIALGNEAVKLEATVLYADLAQSTVMVKNHENWFAAEIYKNYLYCAARIVRHHDGVITAYDGDRIMAVFIGGSKNSNAAKCGLRINYAVRDILRPATKAQYPNNSFDLRQRVGIDTSPLFIARTGIRGSNDLVWVGNAANNAAKMAALPTTYPTYISASVYNMLGESSKYGGEPKRDMWTDLGTRDLGYRIYGSTWWWTL